MARRSYPWNYWPKCERKLGKNKKGVSPRWGSDGSEGLAHGPVMGPGRVHLGKHSCALTDEHILKDFLS